MRYWPGFGRSSQSRAFGSSSALYSAQTLVAGALNVLLIVAAIELLDLGRSGPGLLNSAVGIGGIIGAAVALGLVGLRGLGTAFRLRARALGASPHPVRRLA